MADEDVPIDAATEIAAFVDDVCAEITKLRAEIDRLRAEVAELRDGGERFRGKLLSDFVALVDEYRMIDAIRSDAKGHG